MLLHDWFDWTNSGVGATGLVVTFAALMFAKGAKKAATEAREAVYQRNAADAFSEIVRHAEQLATWVECERWAEAAVVAREIALQLARDRGEFARFLGSDKRWLQNVELSCDSMCKQCKLQSVDPDFKAVLMAESLAIVKDLSSILGRIRARAEKEEK